MTSTRGVSGFTAFWSALAFVAAGCGSGGASGSTLVQAHQPAPAFRAPDQDGRERTLEEFRGHTLVLYFYPRDGTPGCTTEACAFRDAWDRLEEAGLTVVGVSVDSVESHRQFADEHELQFPLLADTDQRIREAYGVPSRLGMASRVTFLIDGSGYVRRVFPDVDPAVHVDEVLAAARELSESEH